MQQNKKEQLWSLFAKNTNGIIKSHIGTLSLETALAKIEAFWVICVVWAVHLCITVCKGSFGELESKELCFLGDLGSVLTLNYLHFAVRSRTETCLIHILPGHKHRAQSAPLQGQSETFVQPFIFTVVTEWLDLGEKKLTFVYFHRKQSSLFILLSGSVVLTMPDGMDLSLALTKDVRRLPMKMGQRNWGVLLRILNLQWFLSNLIHHGLTLWFQKQNAIDSIILDVFFLLVCILTVLWFCNQTLPSWNRFS